MNSSPCPLEIDLVEVLYGTGEVSIPLLYLMARDKSYAWRVASGKLADQVAVLWLQSDHETRRLQPWEVASVIRSRLHGSSEITPADEMLVLKSAPKTSVAYHNEFWPWFDERFGPS
ncbi:MAG: hypothetical protein H7210_14545 [Pyrinomonadaceae bacterium]|nr:hypothetical protein [Phycisphaerales bacterium]